MIHLSQQENRPEGVMIGKLDDYLRFQETALSLRAQRQ